jgi:cell growth-regulating nucleolar protein
MVVFECAKCNESFKKPKLEKHLQICGSAWVSCIDCNKTFGWGENGWEWMTHNSCVSEAQKYQGNLFQGKDKENKGQAKQDTWTANVENAIEQSSASPKIKNLLQRLLGFDNVPRKEKAFVNFVKNSLRIWNNAEAVEMWNAIASAAPPKGPANGNASSGGAPAKAEEPAKQGGPVAAKAEEPSKAEEPVAAKKSDTRSEINGAAEEKWAGWKRALDSELQEHGGEMPWKRLRDSLVARYRSASEHAKEGEVELGNQALATIPNEYLSKKDPLVRLPAGAVGALRNRTRSGTSCAGSDRMRPCSPL